MNKSKIWMAIASLLLLVNITTLVMLWNMHRHQAHQANGGSARDFISTELHLTDRQQQQYDSLRKLHHEAMMALNSDDRQAHDNMFKNISVTNIDTAALNEMSLQLSKIEMQKQQLTLYHFRDLRKLLTDTQQKKFDEILEEALRLIGKPNRRSGPSGDGPPPPPRRNHGDEQSLNDSLRPGPPPFPDEEDPNGPPPGP